MRLYQWESTQLDHIIQELNNSQPSQEQEDHLHWKPEISSGYSIKSFMDITTHLIYNRSLNTFVVEFIWSRKTLLIAEMLAWFLAKEKLKTGEYLLNLGIIQK